MASIFLGTTAIKDFWDLDHPNFLLAGDWCKIYGDAVSKDLRTLPYLWQDVKDVYKAQIYCESIYNKVLPIIAKELNEHLHLNNKTKYYHIILGNWLINFIHQAYDKYKIIQEASIIGPVKTYVIDSKEYCFPFDYLDYSSKANTDIYQLQLFSEVVKYMDISFEIKHTRAAEPRRISPKRSKVQNFKKYLSLFINLFYKNFSTNEAVIVQPYFKKNKHIFEFKLWLKSKGRISFDPFNYFSIKELKENNLDFRNSIKPKSNNFDDWIIPFIIKNIPQTYLEYHHENIQAVSNIYSSVRKKTFITYNDLYHNTAFQFYIAQNHDKHNIYSAQHGCGYGMDLRHEGEVFERSISDIFFTYGWNDSEKTKPLPMPKILNDQHNNSKKNNILFLTTIRPRYVKYFHSAPTSSKMLVDHVKNPIRFLKNLNNLNQVYIRHHPIHDIAKWNNRQRIKDEFPDIKEDLNNTFYESMHSCKIFVTDHIGTTFLEALQSNTPSIVFINKNSYLFREDFKPYIENFIKFNILFYCPREAAYHMNSLNNNPDKWWLDKELQILINRFIKEHALTSDNWMDEWCKTLLSS